VLFLTGVFGPSKPTPGFHPTATQPALAARQTAEVFLTAWKNGQVRKAASYTNHPAAAAAALTSYRDGLQLRGLQLAVHSATARGIVAFSVAATVVIKKSPTVTATWSYTSQLAAYEKGLNDFVEKKYPGILETLRTKKALDEQTEGQLKKALDEYGTAFGSRSGGDRKN